MWNIHKIFFFLMLTINWVILNFLKLILTSYFKLICFTSITFDICILLRDIIVIIFKVLYFFFYFRRIKFEGVSRKWKLWLICYKFFRKSSSYFYKRFLSWPSKSYEFFVITVLLFVTLDLTNGAIEIKWYHSHTCLTVVNLQWSCM